MHRLELVLVCSFRGFRRPAVRSDAGPRCPPVRVVVGRGFNGLRAAEGVVVVVVAEHAGVGLSWGRRSSGRGREEVARAGLFGRGVEVEEGGLVGVRVVVRFVDVVWRWGHGQLGKGQRRTERKEP